MFIEAHHGIPGEGQREVALALLVFVVHLGPAGRGLAGANEGDRIGQQALAAGTRGGGKAGPPGTT